MSDRITPDMFSQAEPLSLGETPPAPTPDQATSTTPQVADYTATPDVKEKTEMLANRVPVSLFALLNRECSERGITRSELLKEILNTHFHKPGATDSKAALVIEQQQQHISQLTAELEQTKQEVQTVTVANKVLIQQRDNSGQLQKAGLPHIHDYAAELEAELLAVVDYAAKSIMPTRKDFTKRFKHYARLTSK